MQENQRHRYILTSRNPDSDISSISVCDLFSPQHGQLMRLGNAFVESSEFLHKGREESQGA